MSTFIKASRRTLASVCLASTVALGASGAFAEDPTTLKFGSFVGPTSFLNVDIFEPWFEKIEADSGGALKVEFLTGGSTAKPQEVIDAVQTGIIDIGWSITAYNPGRFDSSGVAELPQIANNSAEASAAMAGLYEQGLLDGFDDVVVIGVGTADVARLHHVDDVEGLAGFKGAKIRAAGKVLSAMIEKQGATPVGMPITTVAESLAKNVIDGAAADWFSLEGFRLIDVTKTHIDIPLGAPAMYLVMNKARYEQLPDSVKAAFEKNTVRDFANFWGGRIEAKSNGVRDVVSKMDGHKIIVPGPEEATVWEVSANDVIASWADNTDNGDAILKAYREGVKAHRAK